MARDIDFIIGDKPENTGSVCTCAKFSLSDLDISVGIGSANPIGGGRSTPVATIRIGNYTRINITVFGQEALKYNACRNPHEAIQVAYQQLHGVLTPATLRNLVQDLVFNAHEVGKVSGRQEIRQGFLDLMDIR